MGCKTSQLPSRSLGDDLKQYNSVKVYRSSKKIEKQSTLRRNHSAKNISTRKSQDAFFDDFELDVIQEATVQHQMDSLNISEIAKQRPNELFQGGNVERCFKIYSEKDLRTSQTRDEIVDIEFLESLPTLRKNSVSNEEPRSKKNSVILQGKSCVIISHKKVHQHKI